MTSVAVPDNDLAPNLPSREVTISATNVTEGGVSLRGQWVNFALSDSIDVTPGGDMIAKTSQTITLDSAGNGRIRLPVYDTSHGKGWEHDKDWAIIVTTSWGSSKAIRVPQGSGSIPLSYLPAVRPLSRSEMRYAVTGVSLAISVGTQAGEAAGTAILDGGILRLGLKVPPAGPHTHPQSDITGLVAALAGKSPVGHTHTISQVSGLEDRLDKAWHKGTIFAASNLNTFKTKGIYTFSAKADPTNRPEGASPAGHLTVLPYGGDAVEQVWLDVGGGWYANRSSDSQGVFGAWKRTIDRRIPVSQVDGLYTTPGLVFDDFERKNGSLGTPTSGGAGWAATAGTGNSAIWVLGGLVKAYSGSGNSHAYVPGGTNVTVTATIAAVAASPIAGVVARYTDDTNHLVAQPRESPTKRTYTLFERRGGSVLYPLVTSSIEPQVGDRFGVRAVGGAAQLIVNGVSLGGAVTERPGTLAGVYFNGDDLTTAFSDFTVTEA